MKTSVRSSEQSSHRTNQQNKFAQLTRPQVKTQILEILDNIGKGPEPFLSEIGKLTNIGLHAWEEESLQKWGEFLAFVKKRPFFDQRAAILKFFHQTRKLRMICHRGEAIISALPHPKSARNFFSKILEFLISTVSNSPIDLGHCAILISLLDELLSNKIELDIGPHNTIKFVRLSEIFSLMTAMKQTLRNFRDTLLFVSKINKLTQLFNILQSEGKKEFELLYDKIPLNLVPALHQFDNAVVASMHLSVAEKQFINGIFDFLAKNGVDVSKDGGFSYSKDTIITPDMTELFSKLRSSAEKCEGVFSERFSLIKNSLMREPITESLVFEALSEVSYVKSELDFKGEPNENVDVIFETLKIIHTIYVLMISFDFCGIFPFSNAISLVYARTFVHELTKEDLLDVPLFDQIKPEKVQEVNKMIDSLEGIASCQSIKSIKTGMRKHFKSIISIITENYSQTMQELLTYILALEANEFDDQQLPRLVALLESLQRVKGGEKIAGFYEEVCELRKQISFHENTKQIIDFLTNFFGSVTAGMEESCVRSFPASLMQLLEEAAKDCIEDQTIRVSGGLDESLFTTGVDDGLVEKFIDFNNSFVITTDALNLNSYRLTSITVNGGNKSVLDAIYSIDLITRGNLSRDLLIRLLNVALISNHKEMEAAALSYIRFWRFVHIRDEVAWNISIYSRLPEQRIAYSLQRHYNMKLFLESFATALLYLYIACGVDGEEVPLQTVKECIAMRKYANEIPFNTQADAELVSNIDVCFRKLKEIFNSIKISRVVEKIEALLNSESNFDSQETMLLSTLLHKTIADDDISVINYQEIVGEAQKLYEPYGESGTAQFVQFISYINTISLYQHMRCDITSYQTFILTSQRYLTFIKPLLIIAQMPDNYNKPIVQMQIGLAPANKYFNYFCFVLGKGEVESIVDEDDIIDPDIQPPNEVQDIDVQNKIAEVLKRESGELKRNPESGRESAEVSSSTKAALQELMTIKQQIQEAEDLEQHLQKIMKEETCRCKEDLKVAKQKYNDAATAFKEENEKMQNEIDDLQQILDPLVERVSKERAYLNSLKKRLDSMNEAESLISADERYQNEHQKYELGHFLNVGKLPTPYVRNQQTNQRSEDEPSSVPHLPIPILIHKEEKEDHDHVSPSVSSPVDNADEPSDEEELFIPPKMVATPASLQSIIGKEWPECMKQSVQRTVNQLATSGGDSKSFLMSLKESE